MYDTIIIGGGISGLYAAYKIKKKYPESKLLILERNRHGYLGGRTGNAEFHGTNVVTGAGIGRKKKDKLLLRLLRELDIPIHEFTTGPSYSRALSEKCYVKSLFLKLQADYSATVHSGLTFKQYATSIIGKEEYHHFIMCAGYTDYENESAHDTLYHYGFEDNYEKWKGFAVPWSALIKKLAVHVGEKNIKQSQNVLEIEKTCSSFKIKTKTDTFESNAVIIATTINPAKTMLSSLITKAQVKLYEQIHSQPFLRIYGKFSKESIRIMKIAAPQLTIVPGPLHKIIPMDPDKGIYMIAYTDNVPATMLHEYEKNNKTNRDILCRLLEQSLDLPKETLELEDISEYYWKEGTHYYAPLKSHKTRDEFIKAVQRPLSNILVVGEMVSKNQGWVEGALESVEQVLS
jgi:monoamine oxidase